MVCTFRRIRGYISTWKKRDNGDSPHCHVFSRKRDKRDCPRCHAMTGLSAFRDRMINEGNPSSSVLEKVFGKEGAADFFRSCVMPMDDTGIDMNLLNK